MARTTGRLQFFASSDDLQNADDALQAWRTDDTQVILADGYGMYAVGTADATHRGWDITCPEALEALLKD